MISDSKFKPASGLANRHLQTLLASSPLRPRHRVDLRREKVELPDGDFVHVDWADDNDGPLMVVLHGLEGSAKSRYAAAIMRAANEAGWSAALLYARGCSGEPNRHAASYHAGQTADLRTFLDLVYNRWPDRPVVAVGYSLGGNVLLKYLGEQGSDTILRSAVTVSVPFDLDDSCTAIDQGFSRFYQWVLMRRMRNSLRRKFGGHTLPVKPREVPGLRSFREFDDRITAPLNGFEGADDYYQRASSRQFLINVRIPTLMLQAADDPFMTHAAIPTTEELSPSVTLELSEQGGHVGFLGGSAPWKLAWWLEPRIIAHFRDYLPSRECTDETSETNNQPLTVAG